MFQDFITSKRDEIGMSEEQIRDLVDRTTNEKNLSFYSALLHSGFITQEQVVLLAAEYFEMAVIPDPFTVKVDFDTTTVLYHTEKKTVDMRQVIQNQQFFVTIPGADDAKIFIIREPENEMERARLMSIFGQMPTCAVLTDEAFDIIQKYQLKPKLFDTISREMRPSDIRRQAQLGTGANNRTSPVEELLDGLMIAALERRATDMRIVPIDAEDTHVWLTVDGRNMPYCHISTSVLENLRNVLKNRADCPSESPGVPVEGRISFMHDGVQIDVRINIVTAFNGYDFNFRFITTVLRSLDDLGMSDENLAKYKRILNLTKGLVVISGPTGSGKTSLLYAGFRVSMAKNKHIYSIEDPVEIALPGITQVEVNETVGVTKEVLFASALRHRPDIVAFGEIRNLDDAAPAINFAHTGHPAHATLHANDAIGVISRLTNMGVDPYVLGDTLAAVIAQRLIRRVCPYCAEEYDLDIGHPWRNKFNLGNGPIHLKRGCGCAKCAGTGYLGQMAIDEILITTPKVREAIQMQKGSTAIREVTDFQTYLDDGKSKALVGLTTFDELEDIASDVL